MKLSSCILLFLLLFIKFQTPLRAQNEFTVDSTVNYKVDDLGKTIVTHDIYLENNFSTLYATTYSLSFENIDAQNIKSTTADGASLIVDSKKTGDTTDIKVTFNQPVVGKGVKRHFYISYENSKFAVRTGEVWELSIPKLNDPGSFGSYSVNIYVPESFGLEAYISPKPRTFEESEGFKHYTFNKADVSLTGITAGFGQFQVFTFNLSYHLENPLTHSAETQIAIPPDTAFQKVYFQKIDPKPKDVQIDVDGNWLATYMLTSRQRIDVNVVGSVQIFAGYRSFPKPTGQTLSDNLKESNVWQVNDPAIKALAKELKTPRAIYDFVSQTLKYDLARVQPNVQRMGALEALKSPNQAICMEFTDLFIAIARSAGIPAREINGYAYTENPDLQPLGLVADVLHAWPEYYDVAKGVWIPIDPTWASTTGGVNFFDKLDLRHFTFVIHGENYQKPYAPGSYKLGTNPQKDVFVSFGKLPATRNSIPRLTLTSVKTIPFIKTDYSVKISNPGPAGMYSIFPTIYFDSEEKSRDFIEALPPLSSYTITIKMPFSLLGKDTPNTIKVVVGESELEIPTNKTRIVLGSLVLVFAAFFAILIFILVKLKKITFGRITATIRSFKGKIYGIFTKKRKKDSNLPGSR